MTQFGPSMLGMIIDDLEPGDWASIRHLLTGGEALNLGVQHKLHTTLPHADLWNVYGPSETADDALFWRCLPRRHWVIPPYWLSYLEYTAVYIGSDLNACAGWYYR